MVVRSGLCLGVLSILFGGDGRAQEWETFDAANAGLLSERVQAIAHDSSGNTWLGTEWGLYKYDGASWETFLQATSDLPENDIRALACDHQGRLWVGMFTQGLAVFDGNEWLHFPGGTPTIPGGQFRNIAFDEQGFGWLATTEGLIRTDLEDWRLYINTDASYGGHILPGANIADVAVRDDGLVMAGTLNAGLIYLTDTSLTVYNSFNIGLPDNTALGVAFGQDGDRWLACPYGGLIRNFSDWTGGLWSHYLSENSGLPSNALNDVAVDRHDRKIIACQAAGVAILSGFDDWEVFSTGNSTLPDNEVLCLALRHDGVLWVGTGSGGAARYDMAVGLSGPTAIAAKVKVHPVPATDRVHVDPGNFRPTGWRIRDMAGRPQREGAWTGGPLDVSGLAQGYYLVDLISEGEMLTARIAVL